MENKRSARISSSENFLVPPRTPIPDPVLEFRRNAALEDAKANEAPLTPVSTDSIVIPALSIRESLKVHCGGRPRFIAGDPRKIYQPPPYLSPKTRRYVRGREAARRKYQEDLNFCRYILEATKLPKFASEEKVLKITIPSPEPSATKVKPKELSPSPSEAFPILFPRKLLRLRKPKSGIYINTGDKIEEYDSFDLMYKQKPRPGFEEEMREQTEMDKRRFYLNYDDFEEDLKSRRLSYDEEHEHIVYMRGSILASGFFDEGEGTDEEKAKEEIDEREKSKEGEKAEGEKAEGEKAEGEKGEGDKEPGDEGEKEGEEKDEKELIKVQRQEAERLSKSTSYKIADIDEEKTEEEPNLPPVGQLVQKFRRSSELNRFHEKHVIEKGTLESHSFTGLHQPILKNFEFGVKCGTFNQGGTYIDEQVRNKQGITIPVTAYCYALLRHPSQWSPRDIDDILYAASSMYLECIAKFKNQAIPPKLSGEDLPKYCYLLNRKVRFNVTEPQVSGFIRSNQRNVYNLTKGLAIFFSRYTAGIFQTQGYNIGIWRDRYFYMFDAQGRTGDLIEDPRGKAVVANFHCITGLVSAFLKLCMFGNWPFAIIAIEAYNILHKDDPDGIDADSDMTFKLWGDRKAVLQGNFDLGDQCFGFARNKQALPISVVALVYSRISPPNSWAGRSIDKIMAIGNQLYLECVGNIPRAELKLDELPAEFTLGPYEVEIHVKPNVCGDLICRDGICILQHCLGKFYEKRTLAIVVVANTTMAMWKYKGFYYCFDPYSRNDEGHVTRNGSACLSVHKDLDSLALMITRNFCNKESPFYIHSLNICKVVHQAPEDCVVPLNSTLRDLSIEDLKRSTKTKGKKTATAKLIKVKTEPLSVDQPSDVDEDESLIELDYDLQSLTDASLPMLNHVPHIKPIKEMIVDLEAASLSDTQIDPPRVSEHDYTDLKVDVQSYQLAMEEVGEKKEAAKDDGKKGKGDETKAAGDQEADEDFYFAADAITEMMSGDFTKKSVQLSAGIVGFPYTPQILPPTDISKAMGRKRELFFQTFQSDGDSVVTLIEQEPDVTQSEELRRPTNFLDTPDGSQIIRGRKNMSNFITKGDDVDYLAPFVSIMAIVVSKKFSLVSWNLDIVDYVLTCGYKLYKSTSFRYDQVANINIPKISLGKSEFNVIVEHVHDSPLKENILELTLNRLLFNGTDNGIFVTTTYSCAVFVKNHLFYLYDGYNNNEVGLGEGFKDTGAACLIRFTDLRSLVQRIFLNKSIREGGNPLLFSKFVVSRITIISLGPPRPVTWDEEMGEDDQWTDISDQENEGDEVDEPVVAMQPEVPPPKIEIDIGWQMHRGVGTIRGTKSLKNRGVGKTEIKQDHFTCICACLMLIEIPLRKWDSLKVDQCLDQGKRIYHHVDNLCATTTRIIKNILIRKHLFSVIVKRIQLNRYNQRRTMGTAIDALLKRKCSYFLVQMIGSCNVVYKYSKNRFCLFDPYAIDLKGRPVGTGKAGWIKYKNLRKLKRRLMSQAAKTGGLYTFYSFDISFIKKAPKKLLIQQNLLQYETSTPKTGERFGKFNEKLLWLELSPLPWSRMKKEAANGTERGSDKNMWFNWDVEHVGDLYSLIGKIHQCSGIFSIESRGKQTLCNLVMSIAMLHIYGLKSWNSAIIDSILVNGDHYCKECIRMIVEENYELDMEDLRPSCELFPYSFRVKTSNVLYGSMFMMSNVRFNLYKALCFFFDGVQQRTGILTLTTRKGTKRNVAFGKLQDMEYFMFDCETYGEPMFLDGESTAYILRCTTLNRLVHILTMTLRGGEFFIFDVKTYDFRPLT